MNFIKKLFSRKQKTYVMPYRPEAKEEQDELTIEEIDLYDMLDEMDGM